MRAKSVLIVGIAIFAASCATMAGKPVQSPPAPGIGQPQAESGPPGIGSNQQGPSLNGELNDNDHTTGVSVAALRIVGGQLFWGAAH
jgi:hypothetical protein